MEEKIKKLQELTPDSIALRLKAYRRQHGVTQDGFAKRLGIGRTTLHRWENASVKLSRAMLKILVMERIL